MTLSRWSKYAIGLLVVLSIFSGDVQADDTKTLYNQDNLIAPGVSPSDLENSATAAQALLDQKNGFSSTAVLVPDLPQGLILKEYFYSSGIIRTRQYRDSLNRLTQVWNYRSDGTLNTISYLNPSRGSSTRFDYYNQAGYMTRRKDYNDEGLLSRITDYSSVGVITLQRELSITTGLRLLQRRYYSNGYLLSETAFNDQGRRTDVGNYDPSGQLSSYYKYDASTQYLTYALVFQNGKLSTAKEYTGKNKLIKQSTFDLDGKVQEVRTYDPVTYYLVQKESFYTNGMVSERVTYQSSNGAKIQMDQYRLDGTHSLKEEYKPALGISLRKTEYDLQGEPLRMTEYDDLNRIIRVVDYNTPQEDPENVLVFNSLKSLQTSLGLIASHPLDQGVTYHDGIYEEWAKILASDQAYTYDQAIFGISMIENGDINSAKKTFDFFYAQMKSEAVFSGFWTVYDKNGGWKKYEWRKGMGENTWIALFAMKYYAAAVDLPEKEKALEMAKTISSWITTLPHNAGAVAMGADIPGNPNYGRIYSTENMLDYYALLKSLIAHLPDSDPQKNSLRNDYANLKEWFRAQCYDRTANEFRRGGQFNPATGAFTWDPVKALDVNSWAISAIGLETMAVDFAINIDAFVANIENKFAVQDDGNYGGNIFTAKGFDFSDLTNAQAIRSWGGTRPALVWAEGTQGMIAAYWELAKYYTSKGDSARALTYTQKAEYFIGKLKSSALRIVDGDNVYYRYADTDNVQIFSTTYTWYTPSGPVISSSAWMTLALKKVNPFTI